MSTPSAAPGVTVVGEALVDVVVDARGDRVTRPGGSPMNVAIGLARLGVTTRLVTQFGDDGFGAMVSAHVAESGVDVQRVGRGATSTATATVRPDGSAHYEFDVHWDPGPLDLGDAHELLHVGSLGAWLAPGGDEVFAAVAARADGILASFDPNIRMSLIDDVGEARRRIERLVEVSDVVKLSDEDAAHLFPATSPDAVLDGILARGARLAVMTRGADGSLLRTADLREEISAASVGVVDTIGAGDSFMSALLATLLRDDRAERLRSGTFGAADLHAVGWVASTAAGITVSRVAADPPDTARLDAALAAHTITERNER